MLDPDDLPGTKHDLAAALRELRRASGLSGARLAERVFMAQSKISRMESGRRIATVSDVERILRALEADERTRTRLLDLARLANTDYRSRRDNARRGLTHKQAELREFERAAKEIRYFLPAVPTGLLHTRSYALATLAGLDTVTEDACERVVNARMERQAALDDADRSFRFLLSEQAVRARVATSTVMAGQCAHMAELCAKPGIEISVLPFAAPWPVMPLNTTHSKLSPDQEVRTCRGYGAVSVRVRRVSRS